MHPFSWLSGQFFKAVGIPSLSFRQVIPTKLDYGSADIRVLSSEPKSFGAMDLMKNLILPTSSFYCLFVWFPQEPMSVFAVGGGRLVLLACD